MVPLPWNSGVVGEANLEDDGLDWSGVSYPSPEWELLMSRWRGESGPPASSLVLERRDVETEGRLTERGAGSINNC